jgi:hypothetical protein
MNWNFRNDIAQLLIVSVLIFAGKANSQVVELFSGFKTNKVQPGDSFAIEIINTGADPITFYPLTVFDSVGHYIFLNEQNYISYLKYSGSQTGGLKAHARVIKSAFFINGNTPVNEFKDNIFYQEIADKKYAFPQWFLTSCNYLCGEYWAISSSLLSRSKLFDNDSIWDFNISGVHSLGEGVISGDTVLIDFDPSMPRFLDTLPNGSFVSAADAHLHPEYLDTQNFYRICNERDSCWINESVTKYYHLFFRDSALFKRYQIRDISPQNMRGTWTLCSGCSMLFEVKVPEFVLDLNNNSKKILLDSVVILLLNHSDNKLLFSDIAQRLFDTSTKEKGYDVLNNVNFIFAHELKDVFNANFFGRNYISFKLKIPASPKGYTANDLQLPLAINEIKSDSGLIIDGNFIPSGQQFFKLWDEGGILDKNENFTLADSEFNFVNNIAIPPNNSVEMKIYYNQLLYKIFEGFSVDFFSATPDISIKTFPANK